MLSVTLTRFTVFCCFTVYFISCSKTLLPVEVTGFHQTLQSATAAPENINADLFPYSIEDWFISELDYIVCVSVCVCAYSNRHTEK